MRSTPDIATCMYYTGIDPFTKKVKFSLDSTDTPFHIHSISCGNCDGV